MSIADDPLAFWRAAFGDARRRADPIAAARAAARLQAEGPALTAGEFLAAREARIALGRALRDARARRAAPLAVGLADASPIVLRRRGRVPLGAAAAVLLALLVSTWLVVPRDPGDGEAGGGGAPAAAAATAAPITAQSRGRVVLAVAAVVPAVTEQPQVTASPDPIAVIATPGPAAPTSGAGVPGGPPGSGGPGSGGPGNGSRSGSGATPVPTAARRPAPTFAICLSSVTPGFARLCGQVLDARTGGGLADACVSLGPCSSQSARTDPNGQWSFPLVVGDGTLTWFLEFSKPGYATSTFSQTSREGRILIPTLVLAPN